MHPNKKIHALLGKIYDPSLPRITPGLDRMRHLLNALGNPEKHIPPVIHVAGTNGKGSVCANLMSVYTHAGLKVHRYTSPHLVTFNERITLAGEAISDALLEECLTKVAAQLADHPVTFFEATTAAAFLAFSKVDADLCLLEVGLGGRLDATNVIDKPLLTVITPVGIDHQEYLGDTIEAIAAEKAGIIKPGVPCVVAIQQPEVRAVIEARAKEIGAEAYVFGGYWKVEKRTYQSKNKVIVFDSNLAGVHQLQNAGLTLACVETLNRLQGWDISAIETSQALTNVSWPGRLQPLKIKTDGAKIWLDGAHNLLGAQALETWLKDQPEPRTLVCGMLENRDPKGFIGLLAPLCHHMIAIEKFTQAPAHSVEAIEAVAEALNLPCESARDVPHLLRQLKQSKGTVLITGSLYLVGAVLAEV